MEMKKRVLGFTLMELVIVVVVVGVLATVGIPAYQNVVEDSKAKVCATNIEALQTGLDMYAMEHDVMPGDLSKLPQKTMQKAYAQVFKNRGWEAKLAYYVVGWEERGLAFAELMTNISHGIIRRCPSDSVNGFYAINSQVGNYLGSGNPMTVKQYRDNFSGIAIADFNITAPNANLTVGFTSSNFYTSDPKIAKRHKNFGQPDYPVGSVKMPGKSKGEKRVPKLKTACTYCLNDQFGTFESCKVLCEVKNDN